MVKEDDTDNFETYIKYDDKDEFKKTMENIMPLGIGSDHGEVEVFCIGEKYCIGIENYDCYYLKKISKEFYDACEKEF